MQPGIHKLSWQEYFALDAINNGRLADFRRSPAACRLRLAEPIEPTRAMILGTAVHVALLESERFGETYAPLEFDGRTKEGKAERAANAERGAIGLSSDDYRAALAMAHSLYTHPRVRRLIEQANEVETSAVWGEPAKARLCKSRRDLVGPGWIADVKTTADLDRFSPWAVTDLGYYRQAAWYKWGSEVLGSPVDHFFLAVVSNTPPYESALFRVADETMAAGQIETQRLLAAYLRCEEMQTWPRHVAELMTATASGARLQEIENQ
jgi:exodeoxyribonuclease VIII